MKKLIKIFAPVLALFALAGCATKESDGTYPMGVMLPLSGDNAAAARETLNGMEIARDEINAAGGFSGVPVKLVVRDSDAKEFTFRDAYDSMRQSGVKVFNIGFDREVVARHKIITMAEDVFVNLMCRYPPATIDTTNATRIFINGAQEGDILAKSVDRSDGLEKRIIIMNADTLGGKSCGDYLAFNLDVGKTKIFKDVFAPGETRFDFFSQQILTLQARYVFFIGHGRELKPFLQSLGKRDFKGIVSTNCGYDYENVAAPEGIILSRIETLFQQGKINTPESKNFVAAYKKRFGTEPTWMAAYGYDSVKLLAQSAVAAKLNPKNMQQFFKNAEFDGAIGKMKFDSTADPISELDLVRMR